MTLVLDTCAVLWCILEPEMLSAKAAQAITAESARIIVSAITAAEIACGVDRARIALDRHWKRWFRHFVALNQWQVGAIDLETMEESYSLPEYQGKDPADRIIIATARLNRCAVVTADQRILSYAHVETVW